MSAEPIQCAEIDHLVSEAKAAPALRIRLLATDRQRLDAEGRANQAMYLSGIWQSIGIISLIGNGIMAMVIVIQAATR